MWQRFTERARKVIFYAQEEAQKFGEGYVSTEHLLLGLVRESDSVATHVLERLGVSLSSIRAEVEKQLPKGETRHAQDMSLTPRAKRVIDLAYDEARNLNNNYIGTEHLLLGLIREGDGLAGYVLAKLGVELDRVRREIMDIQDRKESSSSSQPDSQTPDKQTTDYSVLAARALSGAEKEAATFGMEGKVRPGHLLMALTAEKLCAASHVLTRMRVPRDEVFTAVRSLMPKRESMPRRPVRTEMFNSILSDSADIAKELQCQYVSTEHMLLALVGRSDPVVSTVLRDQFGLNVESVLAAINDFYDSEPLSE